MGIDFPASVAFFLNSNYVKHIKPNDFKRLQMVCTDKNGLETLLILDYGLEKGLVKDNQIDHIALLVNAAVDVPNNGTKLPYKSESMFESQPFEDRIVKSILEKALPKEYLEIADTRAELIFALACLKYAEQKSIKLSNEDVKKIISALAQKPEADKCLQMLYKFCTDANWAEVGEHISAGNKEFAGKLFEHALENAGSPADAYNAWKDKYANAKLFALARTGKKFLKPAFNELGPGDQSTFLEAYWPLLSNKFLMDAGQELLTGNNVQQKLALSIYEKLNSFPPTDSAKLKLSEVAEAENKPEFALAALENVKNKEDADIRNRFGELYAKNEKYISAVEQFYYAARFSTSHTKPLENMARLLEKELNAVQLEFLAKYSAKVQNPEGHAISARAYSRLGNPLEATRQVIEHIKDTSSLSSLEELLSSREIVIENFKKNVSKDNLPPGENSEITAIMSDEELEKELATLEDLDTLDMAEAGNKEKLSFENSIIASLGELAQVLGGKIAEKKVPYDAALKLAAKIGRADIVLDGLISYAGKTELSAEEFADYRKSLCNGRLNIEKSKDKPDGKALARAYQEYGPDILESFADKIKNIDAESRALIVNHAGAKSLEACLRTAKLFGFNKTYAAGLYDVALSKAAAEKETEKVFVEKINYLQDQQKDFKEAGENLAKLTVINRCYLDQILGNIRDGKYGQEDVRSLLEGVLAGEALTAEEYKTLGKAAKPITSVYVNLYEKSLGKDEKQPELWEELAFDVKNIKYFLKLVELNPGKIDRIEEVLDWDDAHLLAGPPDNFNLWFAPAEAITKAFDASSFPNLTEDVLATLRKVMPLDVSIPASTLGDCARKVLEDGRYALALALVSGALSKEPNDSPTRKYDVATDFACKSFCHRKIGEIKEAQFAAIDSYRYSNSFSELCLEKLLQMDNDSAELSMQYAADNLKLEQLMDFGSLIFDMKIEKPVEGIMPNLRVPSNLVETYYHYAINRINVQQVKDDKLKGDLTYLFSASLKRRGESEIWREASITALIKAASLNPKYNSAVIQQFANNIGHKLDDSTVKSLLDCSFDSREWTTLGEIARGGNNQGSKHEPEYDAALAFYEKADDAWGQALCYTDIHRTCKDRQTRDSVLEKVADVVEKAVQKGKCSPYKYYALGKFLQDAGKFELAGKAFAAVEELDKSLAQPAKLGKAFCDTKSSLVKMGFRSAINAIKDNARSAALAEPTFDHYAEAARVFNALDDFAAAEKFYTAAELKAAEGDSRIEAGDVQALKIFWGGIAAGKGQHVAALEKYIEAMEMPRYKLTPEAKLELPPKLEFADKIFSLLCESKELAARAIDEFELQNANRTLIELISKDYFASSEFAETDIEKHACLLFKGSSYESRALRGTVIKLLDPESGWEERARNTHKEDICIKRAGFLNPWSEKYVECKKLQRFYPVTSQLEQVVCKALKLAMKHANKVEIKPITYDNIICRMKYTERKGLNPATHFSRDELQTGKFAVGEHFCRRSDNYTVEISDILSTKDMHPEKAVVSYDVPLPRNYTLVKTIRDGVSPNLVLLPANSAQFLTDDNSQLAKLDEHVYSLEFKKQLFSPQVAAHLCSTISGSGEGAA